MHWLAGCASDCPWPLDWPALSEGDPRAGWPDAQEEIVALFTMHAAKGLEWPIVIPVNTMTGVMAPESAIIDRQTETFYCPVLGVPPEGY